MLEHKATTVFYLAIIALGIVVGVTISGISAVSLGAVNSSSPVTTGTLKIYLTDAPPLNSQDLKYLLINVSSLTLRYQGPLPCATSNPPNEYVYAIPPNVGTKVNLTSLTGNSLFLGADNVPQGNVIEIIFNITGAEAFFTDGSSAQLKVVADGKLVMPVHFEVTPGGSIDVTVDITPNSIHISNGHQPVLSPFVHVTVVETGGSTTTVTGSTGLATTHR
jgi:hypothetical protein